MAKWLITLGIILLVLGLAWPLLSKLGLGKLPGDIHIERDGFNFYFPITTCIVVSLLITELRNQEGRAAKALEFTILTVARTNEVIGARLGEFNFGEKIWTVPRERMKAKRQHRIPLSREALRVLESTRPEGERVFELSNMAMLELLKRMGRNDLTVHGFRSTFRDWAAERTNYPREVVEAALAHVLSDKTEAAYRRGDLFEKRRRLMSEWGEVLLHSAVMSTILRSKQQRFVAEPWFV